MAESQPAGVRLVFRTRATEVELDAHRVVTNYRGVPPRPDCFYDLCVDGELAAQMSITGGDEVVLDFSGGAETRPGPAGTVRFAGLPDRDKLVELWLPWSETTHLVELRTDAPVAPRPDGPPGLAAPRQLDQPGLGRREPEHHLAGARRPRRAASSWSTSGWPAARCSTRSPLARCGTPRPTWSASRSGSTWSTST